MLDSETKARIDSARDILVGKVPDPKSQVEQITIALIYKFMDDMDRQSEELDGKASFFRGEFKKYAWPNLLDKRLSGHERLLLYAEGIEKMNTNKNIPQLFRDIFKNAFLPYRDPETLNLFLKEINGFSYDHSERLGDAFEYLLSVLGTQGDAGQFRTPRHIIDFIVAVVEPQKHETILDPACGTAGFLISAYKHIVRSNDALTPDERARLVTNFRGYDISPDMVRLSLVNLYLHGFANPTIHEYDTLTSEERWDERCDVILANPPFMTPKGGIRPHNRFSIKATRSEVLFVDYIAEHLTPGGRAGVIVPEGIIFQSQNAYKALRKMLVESYLWAVVSLPAGVFNPYSGVKTSILLLDRKLAKRTDEVLFVKIDNEGFDLGAQRRPIVGSQLAEAQKWLLKWKHGHKKAQKAQGKLVHAVSRKRVLASADCTLAGDRYVAPAAVQRGRWPMVTVGEIIKLSSGRFLPGKQMRDGAYAVYGGNGVNGRHAEYFVETPVIAIGRVGAYCGAIHVTEPRSWITDNALYVTEYLQEVEQGYLAEMLRAANLNQFAKVGGQPSISQSTVLVQRIPVPPLEVQEKIVAELNGYRKVIEGARQVIANYKPTIAVDPVWPTVELGSFVEFKNGVNYSKQNKGTGLKVVGVSDFQDRLVAPLDHLDQINPRGVVTDDDCLRDGDILFVRSHGNRELVGRSMLVETAGERLTHSAFTIRLRFVRQNVIPMFYAILFKHPDFRNQLTGRGANISNLSQDILRSLVVPIPPLDVQLQHAAEIQAERVLVDSNGQLVEIFERKIQAKLAELWGENNQPELSKAKIPSV